MTAAEIKATIRLWNWSAVSRHQGIKLARTFGHQIAVKQVFRIAPAIMLPLLTMICRIRHRFARLFQALDDGYDVALYRVRKSVRNIFWSASLPTAFTASSKVLATPISRVWQWWFLCDEKQVVDKHAENCRKKSVSAWHSCPVELRQVGVEYERHARFDSPGYTLKNCSKKKMDGYFSFSSVPIRLIRHSGSVWLCICHLLLRLCGGRLFQWQITGSGFCHAGYSYLLFSSLIPYLPWQLLVSILCVYTTKRQTVLSVIEQTINI